mmetsp:Transcript_5744/g.14354  ORF Transcript_5744/g.14354 Transcript_5744/m.14354 type:complete len:266 (-) Transcript_5744:402-1199(-)
MAMLPLLSSSVDTTEGADSASSERERASSSSAFGGSETFRFFDESPLASRQPVSMRPSTPSTTPAFALSAFSSEDEEEAFPRRFLPAVSRGKRLLLISAGPRPMPNRRASAASNSSFRSRWRGIGLNSSFRKPMRGTAFVPSPSIAAFVPKDDATKGMDTDRAIKRTGDGIGKEAVGFPFLPALFLLTVVFLMPPLPLPQNPAPKDLSSSVNDIPAVGVVSGDTKPEWFTVLKTSLAMEDVLGGIAGIVVIPGMDDDRLSSCWCW